MRSCTCIQHVQVRPRLSPVTAARLCRRQYGAAGRVQASLQHTRTGKLHAPQNSVERCRRGCRTAEQAAHAP